jgi:hypothetical protein
MSTHWVLHISHNSVLCIIRHLCWNRGGSTDCNWPQQNWPKHIESAAMIEGIFLLKHFRTLLEILSAERAMSGVPNWEGCASLRTDPKWEYALVYQRVGRACQSVQVRGVSSYTNSAHIPDLISFGISQLFHKCANMLQMEGICMCSYNTATQLSTPAFHSNFIYIPPST